ncbi:MAG: hypothetical protein R2784_11185 [Saprospiraceae bacterium]
MAVLRWSLIGGTAPYTYTWDNGASMDSIASGLEAGTYTVTILDANFCGLVSQFTIDDGEALETTTNWWAEPCNYATGGTATIEIINGEAPFTITWSKSKSIYRRYAFWCASRNLLCKCYRCKWLWSQ